MLQVHAYKRDFPIGNDKLRGIFAELLPAAVNFCYEESQLRTGDIKFYAYNVYFKNNSDVWFPNGAKKEEDLILHVKARNLPDRSTQKDKCQALIRRALREIFPGNHDYAVWLEIVRASWGSDLDPNSRVTEMQLPVELSRVVESINDPSLFWREKLRPLR